MGLQRLPQTKDTRSAHCTIYKHKQNYKTLLLIQNIINNLVQNTVYYNYKYKTQTNDPGGNDTGPQRMRQHPASRTNRKLGKQQM